MARLAAIKLRPSLSPGLMIARALRRVSPLNQRNINSAGQLARHSELAAEALGLTTEGMAGLKNRADAAVAGAKLVVATDVGVGGLTDGITDAQRLRLVQEGFGTLTSLAGAPATEVAAVIGGTEAEAAALIESAGRSLGVSLALNAMPVLDTGDEATTNERLDLLRRAGIERIGDLRGVDEGRIAEMLGGDSELAGRVKTFVDGTFDRSRTRRLR